MQHLAWHDGMSVGVESIDSDHKQLLALINEIAAAIEDNHTNDVIEEVFQRLEGYVVEHFAREEALMRACNYTGLEEHIQLHRGFTDKVPELKEKLLTADSGEVAAQIYLFLYDWLLSHIVGDDLQFAQQAYEQGLSNHTPPALPLRTRITRQLGRTLTLGQRIALTALLPMIGLAIISTMLLITSYSRYTSLNQLLYVTGMVREVDMLSHSLQIERGLSTGSLNSAAPASFQTDLTQQRILSDKAMYALSDKIDRVDENLLASLHSHFELIAEIWSNATAIREGVDMRYLSHNDMFNYYTRLIEELHAIPASILLIQADASLAPKVTAYNILLHMKESAGKQRALGLTGILNNSLTRDEYQQFSALIGEQRSLFNVLSKQLKADTEMAARWQQTFESENAQIAQGYSRALLETASNISDSGISGELWFSSMSAWSNDLQQLINTLIDETELLAGQQKDLLNIRLYIVTLLVGITFVVTVVLCALLNQSILHPVRRITLAMSRLAKGDRSMRFNERFTNDELGLMVTAYEQCRRSLLQSDISASISSHRQNIAIDAGIKEKERFRELANSDPLTGALNRRKFLELANQELQRVQRYRRPLSAMMLDLDLFKNINDTYGHAAGDEVLKRFHQVCLEQIRQTDILARIGGEEFAILLPETRAKQALDLAQRIREATHSLQITANGEPVGSFTVSIGVSDLKPNHVGNIEVLLDQADKALYAAKTAGRDRVTLYHAQHMHGSATE